MIADTGATGNFVNNDIDLVNETPTPFGIGVTVANSNVIRSKSKGDLPLPSIPAAARAAHKFNDIHQPLLSIGKLADSHCISIFDKEEVNVYHKSDVEIKATGAPVLAGKRGKTGLWNIPIHDKENETPHCVNSAYTQKSMEDLAKYLHHTAGSPVPEVWCKAIDNKQFASWPHLSSKFIRKHLPLKVEETTMGHMKAQRSNVRSTKKKKEDLEDELKELPPEPPRINIDRKHEVCGMVVGLDELTGLICTDLPGKFPFPSSKGMNYIFVL